MAPKKHARILIAGGSIAGLALALMLEKNNIDCLVLEKYGKVAPDLGASIGVFANGLRILDQIGLHDVVMNLIEGTDAYKRMCSRDEKGSLIRGITDFTKHFVNRLGYAPIFVDRQMIVQILYDHIKDKSKIITNKSVNHVEHTSDGVKVVTADGDIFTSEILIGADGVHSRVRQEMWRIADAEKPGHFPLRERYEAATEYSCIFGISKPIDKYPRETAHIIQGNNMSYLVSAGPGDCIYWFLFKKLEKIHHGLYDKVPRYTDADRDRLAEQHGDDVLIDTTGLTFRDLYENKTTGTLQALPEFAFSKWHYGRILVIGDAAHKFNPIGGQGGNSAIEDAAVLTNHLYDLISAEKRNATNLTDTNIQEAFTSIESQRVDRVTSLVKVSHDLNSIQAKDKFVSRFIATQIIPRAGTEEVFSILGNPPLGAARLKMFEVPERPHCDMWYDERPANVFTDGTARLGRVIASIIFAILVGWIQVSALHPDPSIPRPDTFLGMKPKTRFTGIPPIDALMTMTTVLFARTASWYNVEQSLQGLYLNCFTVPLFLIWYVEAYRYGNKGSPITWVTVWGHIMHPVTECLTSSVWFLASIWSFNNGTYIRSVGRHIPSPIARSILPAICIGFIIPTLLVFVPQVPKTYLPEVILLWVFSSVSVTTLIYALSRTVFNDGKNVPAGEFDPRLYSSRELPYLYRAYKYIFVFSLLYHVPSIWVILFSPNFDLARMWFPNYNPGLPLDTHPTAFYILLKWDVLGVFWVFLLAGLFTVWDLRCKGLVTTQEAIRGALLFVVVQPLTGPGAAITALWWWREKKIWGDVGKKKVNVNDKKG